MDKPVNHSFARLLIRRMVPAAILVPFLTGALSLLGASINGWTPAVGTVFFVLSTAAILSWMAWSLSKRSRLMDARRTRRENALLRINKRLSIMAHVGEEKFRAVSDHAADAILSVDQNGSIVYFNHAAQRIFKYDSKDILGQPVSLLLPSRFHKAYENGIKRMKSNDDVWMLDNRVELLGLRKDGSETPVEVSLASWKMGGATYYTAILRDVSDRKRMEESQVQLQARLLRSEKMAALGQLADGIAHEINNPLTAMLGTLHMLLEEDELGGPRMRMDLSTIRDSAKRVALIVKGLLNFVDKSPDHWDQVDINRLLSDTLQLRESDLKISNIQVLKHLDPSLPQILGHSGQLQAVFLNIIKNAEDSMLKGGRTGTLEARTWPEPESGNIIIEFLDNGVGFKEVQRAFEPFYTTKETGIGAGLGLTICYNIVKKHGGDIRAFNQENGAKVMIKIPVYGKTSPTGK